MTEKYPGYKLSTNNRNSTGKTSKQHGSQVTYFFTKSYGNIKYKTGIKIFSML